MRTKRAWAKYAALLAAVVALHYAAFQAVTLASRASAAAAPASESASWLDELVQPEEGADDGNEEPERAVPLGDNGEDATEQPVPLADLDDPRAWFGEDDPPRKSVAALRAYAEYHGDQIARVRDANDDAPGARLLVLADAPSAGLGNRISALVSALALAVLTRRAVVVDWPGTPYVDHPDGDETVSFPPYSHLFENSTFLDLDFAALRRGRPHLTRAVRENVVDLDTDAGARALLCGTDGGGNATAAAVATLLSTDSGPDVLAVSSWDYFLPALLAGRLWRGDADALAFETDVGGRDALPTVLARYLLRPREAIRRRAAAYARKELGVPAASAGGAPSSMPPHGVVGVHLRLRGYNKLSFSQVRDALGCAADLGASWLVATDMEEGFHLAASDARSRGVPLHRFAAIGTAKTRGFRSWEGVEVALAELWLLATVVDVVVASPGSTFTRVASLLSGRPAHVVGVVGEAKPTRCGVDLRRNGAPCYHGWRNFVVGAVDGADAAPGHAAAADVDLEASLMAQLAGGGKVAQTSSCADLEEVAALHRGHADCART